MPRGTWRQVPVKPEHDRMKAASMARRWQTCPNLFLFVFAVQISDTPGIRVRAVSVSDTDSLASRRVGASEYTCGICYLADVI